MAVFGAGQLTEWMRRRGADEGDVQANGVQSDFDGAGELRRCPVSPPCGTWRGCRVSRLARDVVRWTTAEDNYRARATYDRLAVRPDA